MSTARDGGGLGERLAEDAVLGRRAMRLVGREDAARPRTPEIRGAGVTARGPSVAAAGEASLWKKTTAKTMTRATPTTIPSLASLGILDDSDPEGKAASTIPGGAFFLLPNYPRGTIACGLFAGLPSRFCNESAARLRGAVLALQPVFPRRASRERKTEKLSEREVSQEPVHLLLSRPSSGDFCSPRPLRGRGEQRTPPPTPSPPRRGGAKETAEFLSPLAAGRGWGRGLEMISYAAPLQNATAVSV